MKSTIVFQLLNVIALVPYSACQVSVVTSYDILSLSGGDNLANGVGLQLQCSATYDTFATLQYLEFNTIDGLIALACPTTLATGSCTFSNSFSSGVQVTVTNDVVTVEVENYDETVHEIDYKCVIFNAAFTSAEELFSYPSSPIWDQPSSPSEVTFSIDPPPTGGTTLDMTNGDSVTVTANAFNDGSNPDIYPTLVVMRDTTEVCREVESTSQVTCTFTPDVTGTYTFQAILFDVESATQDVTINLEEGSDDDDDKCESKKDKDDEKMKCYGAGWGIGSSVLAWPVVFFVTIACRKKKDCAPEKKRLAIYQAVFGVALGVGILGIILFFATMTVDDSCDCDYAAAPIVGIVLGAVGVAGMITVYMVMQMYKPKGDRGCGDGGENGTTEGHNNRVGRHSDEEIDRSASPRSTSQVNPHHMLTPKKSANALPPLEHEANYDRPLPDGPGGSPKKDKKKKKRRSKEESDNQYDNPAYGRDY